MMFKYLAASVGVFFVLTTSAFGGTLSPRTAAKATPEAYCAWLWQVSIYASDTKASGVPQDILSKQSKDFVRHAPKSVQDAYLETILTTYGSRNDAELTATHIEQACLKQLHAVSPPHHPSVQTREIERQAEDQARRIADARFAVPESQKTGSVPSMERLLERLERRIDCTTHITHYNKWDATIRTNCR